MNIDENAKKILMALLRKWKLLVLFAVIGGLAGYIYTSNFTTPTYTSSVEFQASAVDTESEMNDVESSMTNTYNKNEYVRSSYTSKMNYAMKMIDTYIEIMGTNDFNHRIASEMNARINSDYSASTVKYSTSIQNVENTAMFRMTVTTGDPKLSYEIAHQLELTVPDVINESSDGIVKASVKDTPLEAETASSRGYLKKCAIAAIAGLIIAAAYVILRSLLDIRVKSAEELVETYNIPVLASIPCFEGKPSSHINHDNKEV